MDKKVTELTSVATVSGDDLLLVVNDPLGTPASRKITVANFFSTVSSNVTFDATSTFNGDVSISGGLQLSGSDVTLSINDRLQVANAEAKYASTLSVNDRLQVANAEAKYVDQTTYNGFVDSLSIRATAPIVNAPIKANTASAYVSSANGLVVTTATSNPTDSSTVPFGYPVGTIFWSQEYLYVVTAAGTVKRVTLDTF